MNAFGPLRILIASYAMAVNLLATELPQLEPHLEPLRPWLEKTWKGQQKNSKSGKVATDVVHWERALNGNAIRIVHSIDDGAYGGEAIVMWDQKARSIVYHYFTTDTFNTAGTMTFKNGKILTHDVVEGDAGGITETRATIEMDGDGTYHQRTEFSKNGAWKLATETKYRQGPSADVVFK